MNPPLAYRVVRFQGRFYPEYQRASWLVFLGCEPVWCGYHLSYDTEEDACAFVAGEREEWARASLPTVVIREISA